MDDRAPNDEDSVRPVDEEKAVNSLPDAEQSDSDDKVVVELASEFGVEPDLVEAVMTGLETRMETQGPVPSAHEMQGYYSIDRTLPDRLVAMAEREQQHRHELERIDLESAHAHQARKIEIVEKDNENRASIAKGHLAIKRLSTTNGSILTGGTLFGAIYLAMKGHTAVAVTLGTTTIVSIVGAFIVGKLVGVKEQAKDTVDDSEAEAS